MATTSWSKRAARTSPRRARATTTTIVWCSGWKTETSRRSGNIATRGGPKRRWGLSPNRENLPRLETLYRHSGSTRRRVSRNDVDKMNSRRLGLEMAEHDAARLVVHFGLEDELVFQRDRPRRGRPCRNLVDQPFHVGKFCEYLVAEHERRQACPAPERHVDDGIGIADHVATFGEMVVEDAVMTLRFELVAVVRIFQVFRREMLEMHGLAGIRPDTAGDEHQP